MRAENRNREVQGGSCTGIGSFGYNATPTIEAEYFLRLDVKKTMPAQASRNGSAASGQHAIS